MGNSPGKVIYYKPRFTQMEAYDMMPPKMRDALKVGVCEWDTVWLLNRYNKLAKQHGTFRAEDMIVKEIFGWHKSNIAKGAPWRERKPGQRWKDVPQSPHNLAKATFMVN